MTTMREFYEENGYNPDELVNPKDATAEVIKSEMTIVGYLGVRKSGVRGLTYEIIELPVVKVAPVIIEEPNGETTKYWAVSYERPCGRTVETAAGYGDRLYGDHSQLDDPHRWDRKQSDVHALSDRFLRYKA